MLRNILMDDLHKRLKQREMVQKMRSSFIEFQVKS